MSQSNALDLYIGNRLRELRKERQLSLEKIVELLDVSGQQISRFEKGIHKLNASQLYIVARALGVPLSRLFLDHKDSVMDLSHWQVVVPTAIQAERQCVITDEELEAILLLKWRKMKIQQREALLSLLDVMK